MARRPRARSPSAKRCGRKSPSSRQASAPRMATRPRRRSIDSRRSPAEPIGPIATDQSRSASTATSCGSEPPARAAPRPDRRARRPLRSHWRSPARFPPRGARRPPSQRPGSRRQISRGSRLSPRLRRPRSRRCSRRHCSPRRPRRAGERAAGSCTRCPSRAVRRTASHTIDPMTDPSPAAPLAYLCGADTYGLDAAVEAFRTHAGRLPTGAPARWRPPGDGGESARSLGEIVERLATGSLFGDGTLALLSGAGALTRRGADRDRLLEVLGQVAPGNGLAIVEETESGKKDPPSKVVSEAIRAAGGLVRRIEAPREGALANWIEARARERQVALAPGAARELATRGGGVVREGDVDRSHQGRLAVVEIEKLALRPDPGEPISGDDVKAPLPQAIPGSLWAFLH